MKERGMLFSKPMVRALLAGSKTQTRRLVNHEIRGPNHLGHFNWYDRNGWQGAHGGNVPFEKTNAALLSPYGHPGDRLWVRETFAEVGTVDPGWLLYRASDYMEQVKAYGFDTYLPEEKVKWTPSIHMPRWASRINLEITGVRVERLQDISEADAIAEGIEGLNYGSQVTWRDYSLSDEDAQCSPMLTDPILSYRSLWESISGPGSWDANPWVWCIEFRRIK